MMEWCLDEPYGECLFCHKEEALVVGRDPDSMGLRVCYDCAKRLLPKLLAGVVVGGAYSAGWDKDMNVTDAAIAMLESFTAVYWRSVALSIAWVHDHGEKTQEMLNKGDQAAP